jgi:hypothetical protein
LKALDKYGTARALAAFVMGAWLACAACSAQKSVHLDAMGLPTNRPITRIELSGRPEAQLRYPGSTVVKVIGADEVATRDPEPDPAYAGAILTAKTSAAQLYAWYADWAKAHGYHQVTYYRMSDQTSGVAWRAPGGREQVQVGVFDAAQLAAQQHINASAGAGTLIYEQVLVGYRVNTR